MKRKLIGMLAAVLLLTQGCAAEDKRKSDYDIPIVDEEAAGQEDEEMPDTQPETEQTEGEDMAQAANTDKEAITTLGEALNIFITVLKGIACGITGMWRETGRFT